MNIRGKIDNRIKLFLLWILKISLTYSFFRFFKPICLTLLSFRFRPKISRVCAVAEYVKSSGDRLVELDSPAKRLFYSAPKYDGQKRELHYVDAPAPYIAILSEVSVLAESNLIYTKSGFALNDMMANDREKRLNFRCNKGFDSIALNGTICTLFDKKEVRRIDKGVMISGNYSFNFYHFTFEIMPRLKDIEKFVPFDVPLLIDQAMLRFSQFRELLDYCNVAKREVVVLPTDCQVEVGELFFPSILSYIVPNVKRIKDMSLMDCMYDIDSLDWLRSMLLSIKSDKFFGDKIFLYRKGGVRMFNQDEILAMLSTRGYVCVSTEDLSVADQVSLFSRATDIVSGSGAALTNVLYCSAGCKIFVLTNSRYDDISVFSSIASYVGADMRYVDAGVPLDGENYLIHEDFYISPSLVSKVIDEQS